jgi:hypothetical protein
MTSDNKVKVFKADQSLQKKAGTGTIDQRRVASSQALIDNNQVDFAPLCHAILEKLREGLEQAKDSSVTMQHLKESLTKPVMELKANATTFGYTLIGSLANVMLDFLESIVVMDDDAIEIVRAHHKTLHLIITRKMSGDGGPFGAQLVNELQNACERYYNKKFSR